MSKNALPNRFKFTVPQPFNFALNNENKFRCNRLLSPDSSKDEVEHLKQFRAHPMPGRTFLSYDQLVKGSKPKRLKEEGSGEQRDSSTRPGSRNRWQSSSEPNLNRIGVSRSSQLSGESLRTTPVPLSRIKSYEEFVIEKEIMREIRVQWRADQLLKTSSLPFTGSHWKDTTRPTSSETSQVRHGRRFDQSRLHLGHDHEPLVEPVICIPKCRQIKSAVHSERHRQTSSSNRNIASACADTLTSTEDRHSSTSQKALSKLKSRNNQEYDLNKLGNKPRMTYSSMLREYANRERAIHKSDYKQHNFRSHHSQALRNAILIKVACSPVPSYSNAAKQRELREADKIRVKEYQDERRQMMDRVMSKPLLMERQSKLSAMQNIEKRFKATLRKQGLDQEFLAANVSRQRDVNDGSNSTVSDDLSVNLNEEPADSRSSRESDAETECDASVGSDAKSESCASEVPEHDVS